MLPFLKNNKEASIGGPAEAIKREHDEDFDPIEAAAEDLINAIHSKDVKLAAEALKAAFELCDAQPHMEGEHV